MNEIIISNIPPQNINIGEGGVTGITRVYVNGVDVTEGSNAYVIVPTKLSELINDEHFITSESDPTVPTWVKAISISDINNWNSKVSPSDLDNYVKFTDYATDSTGGVVKIDNQNGIYINSSNGKIYAGTLTYGAYELAYNRIFISKYTLESVIAGKNLETANNKVTSISSSSTDTQYPSAKCMYDSQTLQDNEISDLKSESDYLNSIINQLPKVSSQGTILTLNNTIAGRMNIELGTSELEQDGTPTPDTPYPIHTISGNNKVVVCNKNLMSLGTQQNGYVDAGTLLFQDGSGGIGTVATKSVGYYFKTSQLPDTITISDVNGNRMNVCYFNEIPTYQSQCLLRSASNDNPRTINIDKTYTYVHIQFSYNDENVSNIQVESGSTKTDFVTSTFQEANINLGDIEYCEIGDYKDRFERDSQGNWGIRKNIGKVVLDGSESGAYTNGILYISSITNYAVSNNIPLCTHFKGISNIATGNTSTLSDKEMAFRNNNDVYRLYIRDDTFGTNWTDFQNWLSTHNVILYYALATPTYTPITGTLAEELETIYQYLLSYKGQTSISQINNDLPFNISANALLDLNTLVGGN